MSEKITNNNKDLKTELLETYKETLLIQELIKEIFRDSK